MSRDVLVVIGVGGMGEAVARRLGPGRPVLLADFKQPLLDDLAETLRGEGYAVTAQLVDVSSRASVAELATTAARLGSVTAVVHTAGLSPVQATGEAIMNVDLAGVAFMLEEFGAVVADGGSGVVISSMAGHLAGPVAGGIPAEQEAALRTTPADELLALPFVQAAAANPASAYGFAKRANHVRVQAASLAWGLRGARVNSVSPGIIATPMGQQELDGPSGPFMRAMIDASGSRRLGTPADIAGAVAFLLGPDSTFVTGTDLLVDGGVVAALQTSPMGMPAAV